LGATDHARARHTLSLEQPGEASSSTLEAFYRYQFSNNIVITADAQLLLNPALNPNEDQIAVFGLRARVDM